MHPDVLRAPFARMPDVLQYQLVHRGHELLVRLMALPGAGRDVPEAAAVDVRAALRDAGAELAGRVVVVESIEREPGPAAKVKLVVSEVPVSL